MRTFNCFRPFVFRERIGDSIVLVFLFSSCFNLQIEYFIWSAFLRISSDHNSFNLITHVKFIFRYFSTQRWKNKYYLGQNKYLFLHCSWFKIHAVYDGSKQYSNQQVKEFPFRVCCQRNWALFCYSVSCCFALNLARICPDQNEFVVGGLIKQWILQQFVVF